MKLLFLNADPRGTERLRIGAETREILARLREARAESADDFVQRLGVRPEDIQHALDEVRPDIVHFSGHGGPDGNLCFESADGGSQPVAKEHLVEAFRALRHRIRLVVLNACHSQPLAELIADHIDCAIGTGDEILDEAAIDFAAELYRALYAGHPVATAFALAQNQLRLKGMPEEAAVLRLFSRPGVDAKTVTFTAPAPRVAPAARPEVMLLLDLASDNPITPREVEAELKLAPSATRRILCATAYGALPTASGAGQDYMTAAAAITRMVRSAREGLPTGEPARFYVAGRAPLPLFAHLGLELSALADVTFVNQRKGGVWDVLPMQESAPAGGAPFFEVRRGLSGGPFMASGCVAVFVSTLYPATENELIDYLNTEGASLAGLVEVRAAGEGGKVLDAGSAAQAMLELSSIFQQVRAAYPRCESVALFVAGPTQLAFMAGKAINRHIVKQVWVPDYDQGVYRRALRLPFHEPARREVSGAPQEVRERERILSALRDHIDKLRGTLRPKHLPPFGGDANRLLARLAAIDISREPQGEAFDVQASERRMAFGQGFLEALRHLSEHQQCRVGLCLLLHELFHVDQNLSTALYPGVGRAGVALEEVDYWADAFSVETLSAWEIDRGGAEAKEKVSSIVQSYVDAVLLGMEAFDRFEQGPRLDRLPERRLRRYLIWHLQRVRALTLRRREDLRTLFSERLVAELAPLRGHLDERFDKNVDGHVDGHVGQTELFVVLGGHLLRTSPRPGVFEPRAIVAAVRGFERETLESAMTFVRDQHRQVLTPWVP
jgi:hypothetical protein